MVFEWYSFFRQAHTVEQTFVEHWRSFHIVEHFVDNLIRAVLKSILFHEGKQRGQIVVTSPSKELSRPDVAISASQWALAISH